MILKETISDVIAYQSGILVKQQLGIRRDDLDGLKLLKSFVLVITGIRRSGKSTFLKQLLKEKFKSPLFLNLEDPRLSGFELGDFVRMDDLIRDRSYSALAFDEIQNVAEWETYIRTKQDEGQTVILTGSNASLLSREFGTKLTGRYISTEIFPFSFNEFLKITKSEPSANTIGRYMDLGGFPEFLKNREEEILYRMMDDVIYRDIAVRHGIKQHKVLRQLAIYLISSSGKHYSLNNLRKIFGVGSVRSIADYISFLEDSYLLFSVPKFSYSIKKQIVNPRKVYCIDTGLASVNSLSFSKDLGRKLENMVYLHLRRKHQSIYYYSDAHECDFIVARKGVPVLAVQVCYNLTQDNLDRELKGIESAMNDLEIKDGLIVTFNQEDSFELNGNKITAVPAWKFLMADY